MYRAGLPLSPCTSLSYRSRLSWAHNRGWSWAWSSTLLSVQWLKNCGKVDLVFICNKCYSVYPTIAWKISLGQPNGKVDSVCLFVCNKCSTPLTLKDFTVCMWVCLSLYVFFHQISTSIKDWLPSIVPFHQKSSSIKGRPPSKVVFHQRLSSIKGCLPSKVIFHQRLSTSIVLQVLQK